MSSPIDNPAAVSKRRTLFSRSPLSAIYDTDKNSDKSSNASSKPSSSRNLRRRFTGERRPSPSHTPTSSVGENSISEEDTALSVPARRPTLSLRTGSARPPSIFGSLRSFKSYDDYDEPSTAGSAHTNFSEQWFDPPDTSAKCSKLVLHHGEVQTGSSIFRKRKEYLVLTETHLYKFKSQVKACEMFPQYVAPSTRHLCCYSNMLTCIEFPQDLSIAIP